MIALGIILGAALILLFAVSADSKRDTR